MGDQFRERFFTPFVLPLSIIGVMLLIGVSLARVLLAVPELSAALVAILASGYILAMAFLIERRTKITARTLGIGLAVGLIGLLGAGAVASAAGMRDLGEHGEEHGETAGEGGEGEAPAPIEPVFVAVDIAYESAPEELPVGDVDVELVNNGQIEHNVVIEERGDELILEAQAGERDTATVSFDAGDYTYYCSIAGHREAGMEGTLTVAEGVEVGGGGEAPPTEPASEGGAAMSEAASEAASDG